MPTMSGRVDLGAGADSGNVLLGQQYELAPFHGKMEVGCCTDKNKVTLGIFAGPDTLQEPGGLVPMTSAIDLPPKSPDDYHWEDMVAKGDRLKLTFHNGNAGACVVNWVVRLTPMA